MCNPSIGENPQDVKPTLGRIETALKMDYRMKIFYSQDQHLFVIQIKDWRKDYLATGATLADAIESLMAQIIQHDKEINDYE